MKWLALTAFLTALAGCSGMQSSGSSTGSSASGSNQNDMMYRGGSQ